MENNLHCQLSSIDNFVHNNISPTITLDSSGSKKKKFPNGDERNENQKKLHKCDKCDASFYRYSHLQDHVNRHKGIRSYQCKETSCTKAYFAWKNLFKHLTNFHKIKNVRKSLYVANARAHKCTFQGCNAEFSRPWKLTSHMCQHTGVKLYQCSVNGCNKAYTMLGHLRRHIASSHSMQSNVTKGYSCTEEGCERDYKTLASLRKHYTRHHANDQSSFVCSSCKRSFRSSDLLSFHIATHSCNPPYKCIKEDCKKVYSTEGSLRRHYKQCHVHNQLTVSCSKCLICDNCVTSSLMAAHKTTHDNPPYKCIKCKQVFTEILLWKEHMKVHQIYFCLSLGCNQMFSQSVLLQRHKRQTHKKIGVCKICNKKFQEKWKLIQHQKTHLPDDERELFFCPYEDCTRYYTRKYYMNQHIQCRHLDIKLLCSYPSCGRRLATKQKLKEHMKIHDPSHPSVIRKQIARRQRKDAGQPKRSMAVKLSGVKVSYAEEKLILYSETKNQYCDDEQSESSNEVSDGSYEQSD